jgi:hypothetical protein
MPALDMRTIVYFMILINALSFLIILLLWLQNRKTYPGLALWAVDYLLQILGMTLIYLRGRIPDGISIVVSNTLITGGTVLLLIGLQRFMGKKGLQIHNYALLVALAIALVYFTYVDNNLSARTIALNTGFIFYFPLHPGLLAVCAGNI